MSEIGSSSREKQEVLHTAGTSNFAVVRERLVEEHGADKFDDLDFFDATHKKSDGQFVSTTTAMISSTARVKYAELSSTMASDSTTSDFDALSLQHHALIETRGPERLGHVCEMGLGPTPTQVFEARASSAEDPRDEEIRSLRSGLSQLQEVVVALVRQQNSEPTIPTQKRAERGRASRDAQDVLHTSGGTSFARRRAIMNVERGGADQYGDLDFFGATHMNSQGVFLSSKAATISRTARNRYAELSSASTADFPTTPVDMVQLQHQALVENMGPERHGCVRGKGLGPTPSRTCASSSTQPDPRDENISILETQVANLQATVAHIAHIMRETNVQNPANIPRQQGDLTSSSRLNEEEAG